MDPPKLRIHNSQAASKSYDNELIYQMCHEVLVNQTSDVQFIFEGEEDVIKIGANRAVLAALSPVFNAMFNGDLKEMGDVQIVDVSQAAFKEFLQFFYGQQIKLTMNNITEVMHLIDKYDITGCFPICVDFLEDNLELDDILWGLHLAMKFKLDDLKAFCSTEIQKNFNKIWSKFDIMDDGKPKLSADQSNRYILDEDVVPLYQHVFMISKSIYSSQSDEIDRLRERRVHSFDLVNKHSFEKITEYEIIGFSLSGESMLLTDIFCSNVFKWDLLAQKESFNVIGHCFELCIERNTQTMFSTKVELNDGENHIKLTHPIKIDVQSAYAIVMKSATLWDDRYTYQANIPQESVLAPNVKISFPNVRNNRYKCSLISHLYFERIL